MRDRYYRYIVYAGLCYAGLILTHLINAYMFSFVLAAFIISLSIVRKRPKEIAVLFFVVLIGFLISAAYVIPVIFEKQFVNLKEFIGQGKGPGFLYDYQNFFILPNMSSKFSSAHLWNAYYDMFVLYIFLFCIVIVLSFLQVIKMRKIDVMKSVYPVNIFFLGTAVFTIFLMFGISSFIWENIPFFKYIQFSHRWLIVTTFAVVFLCAALFWVLNNAPETRRERRMLIIILCFMTLAVFLLDYKYIRFTHYINEQELLPVRAPNWYREHLPIWVDLEKLDKSKVGKQHVIILEGRGNAEVVLWQSAERIVEINASEPVTLRIRTFYFPGWRAYLDGVETPIKRHENIGAMLVSIPRGIHTLVLKFEDTPIRYISKLITVFSLFVVIILSFLSGKMKRNR